jgi:aspartate/glutamate racemase
LATKSVIDKKLYQSKLDKQGIKIIIPNQQDQVLVGKLINNLVLSQRSKADREKLLAIIDKIKTKRVKDIILACTDLQLLTPFYPSLHIYDIIEILLKATVFKILKE